MVWKSFSRLFESFISLCLTWLDSVHSDELHNSSKFQEPANWFSCRKEMNGNQWLSTAVGRNTSVSGHKMTNRMEKQKKHIYAPHIYMIVIHFSTESLENFSSKRLGTTGLQDALKNLNYTIFILRSVFLSLRGCIIESPGSHVLLDANYVIATSLVWFQQGTFVACHLVLPSVSTVCYQQRLSYQKN